MLRSYIRRESRDCYEKTFAAKTARGVYSPRNHGGGHYHRCPRRHDHPPVHGHHARRQGQRRQERCRPTRVCYGTVQPSHGPLPDDGPRAESAGGSACGRRQEMARPLQNGAAPTSRCFARTPGETHTSIGFLGCITPPPSMCGRGAPMARMAARDPARISAIGS